MKLWQKQSGPLHPLVEKYTVGNDYHLDLEILPYDLQASLAHAEMLHQIHVLKKTELTKIKAGLQAIQKLHQQQKFTIQPKDEDCHTAIENYLVKKVGPLGSRIHLGRSRNDQVLTALRLYEKSQLQLLQKSVTQTAQTISKFAQKHGQLPMCGYTHGQPAMPSSVKLWAESFAASLKDDLTQLQSVQKLIDQNPLGSAAGYGTCLKLDRKLTTQKLKFKRLQKNSLYCQSSRGKFEAAILSVLTQVMLTLSRSTNDLLLYLSHAYQFFSLPDNLITGSSIMPQKKNPDLLEILRANVSLVQSHQFTIQNITQNLPSGYHRDIQLIKEPLLKSFQITADSLAITQLIFQHLKPNPKKLATAMLPEIHAADQATQLALKKNLPFREAYKKVAQKLKKRPLH